jgi:hypothetical protein
LPAPILIRDYRTAIAKHCAIQNKHESLDVGARQAAPRRSIASLVAMQKRADDRDCGALRGRQRHDIVYEDVL